ncbi:MAG: adenylate/guanylate cyclase domain-containing protein [Anaerolineae bacterium]|nr:adenylate/guanylate cyclase domain-containing protein [Anaerolineae bacterium]
MNLVVLDEKLADLEQLGFAPAVLEQIRGYVSSAAPQRLQRMSPYRMADEWQLPRNEILSAFLFGTRLGLFDLEWNVFCPSCTGVTDHVQHLSQLRPDSHCAYCDIHIDASFDRSIEVTFKINDNVRETGAVTWYELVQHWDYIEYLGEVVVEENSTLDLPLELAQGNYYIGYPPLIVDDTPAAGPQVFEIAWDGESWSRSNREVYHPGPCVLHAMNKTDNPATLSYMRRKSHPWTSAADIVSLQDFRDLFSTELISPDETFSIRDMVIAFTDIKGSTALYERLGDADAYALVKEHFRILTDVVRKHNGAVVKTIGDAVMATFRVSTDAIQALLAMQQAFEDFNVQEKIPEGHIIIKVGGHRGACIAVNSNDRLDYFGRTVNIAARVQGLSTGRDIMLTRSFFDEPSVAEIVAGSHWKMRYFSAELRGIESEYDLVHLTQSGA